MSEIRLFKLELPEDVDFKPSEGGGSQIPCQDCGHDHESAWPEKVWSYSSQDEEHFHWIRAECTNDGCKAIQLFETSGPRDPRDWDRKHSDAMFTHLGHRGESYE